LLRVRCAEAEPWAGHKSCHSLVQEHEARFAGTMNILIQHDPRSIAIRGAGPDPFALIFRHAARSEDSGDRCVVEFLPWKEMQQRAGYKLLNSVEVYGSLGLIDIEEGSDTVKCGAIDY